jgi:hypothetical protein
MAAVCALDGDGLLRLPVPGLSRLTAMLAREGTARAAVGAMLLVMLVHAVETAKFIRAWNDYRSAIRALAMGPASDPALGDPRFVSSERIGTDLNRMAWSSTTPFLSELLAPQFLPARLIVDPSAGYFYISCPVAKANEAASRAIPVESRAFLRAYACQHR